MRSIRQEVELLERLQKYVLSTKPSPRKGNYLEVQLEGPDAPKPFRFDRDMVMTDMVVEHYSIEVRPFTLYATQQNPKGIPAWEYSYRGVLLGIVPQ